MARHDPEQYFFGALTKDEVDQLQAPWDGERAATIAGSLRRLVGAKVRVRRASIGAKVVAIAGATAGILGYVLCLLPGDAESVGNGLLYVLLAAMSAGVVGAGLGVLTGYGGQSPETVGQAVISVLKGAGAGFLAFFLLLLGQLVAEGRISLDFPMEKFLRYWGLSGALGAYGGLCTDALVKRFIQRVAARIDGEADGPVEP